MPKRSNSKKPGRNQFGSRKNSDKRTKYSADKFKGRFKLPGIDIAQVFIRSFRNEDHYGEKDKELFNKIFRDLRLGKQDTALVSIEKYISYFNESVCNGDLANMYNLKGRVLREIGRIDEAQEIYQKNLEMELENNLFFEYIITSNNVAICFQALHEYEIAFHFLNNSKKIAGLLGDQELIGYTHVLTADNYHFLNHFQKADEYYRDGINILKNHLHGENEFGINANIRRAENLARFGKFDLAINILTKYLKICDKKGLVLETQNILRDLFVFFSSLGEEQKSKRFTERYAGYVQKYKHLLKGVDSFMFESEQAFTGRDYTKCIEYADKVINNTTPYQTEIRKIAYDLKAESNEMMGEKINAYNDWILMRLYSMLKYDYVSEKRAETKINQIIDEIKHTSKMQSETPPKKKPEMQQDSLTNSELIIDTGSKKIPDINSKSNKFDTDISENLKKSILSILDFLNEKVELEARLTLFGLEEDDEIPPLEYTILILPDVLSETLKFRAYNITKPQQGFTSPETIAEENNYLEEVDLGSLLWDLFIDFDVVSIIIRNRMNKFHPKTNNPMRKYYAALYTNPPSLTEPDPNLYQNILDAMYDDDLDGLKNIFEGNETIDKFDDFDELNDKNFEPDNSMIHFLSAKRLFKSYITNSVNGSRIRPEMEVIYCNKDDTEQIRGDEEPDAEATQFH